MNIAILVQMFVPGHLGGVEIATYNIASHLAKNGHRVNVITLRDNGLPEKSIERGFFVYGVDMPKIKSFRHLGQVVSCG